MIAQCGEHLVAFGREDATQDRFAIVRERVGHDWQQRHQHGHVDVGRDGAHGSHERQKQPSVALDDPDLAGDAVAVNVLLRIRNRVRIEFDRGNPARAKLRVR